MGGCCCHVETPGSNSGEERSGLLTENLNASTQEDSSLRAGTCGPEGDAMRIKHDNNVVDVKAVELKSSPEVGGTKNGPGKVLAPMLSAGETPEKSPRAPGETITERPVDGAHVKLSQCTLISPEKEVDTVNFSAARAATPAPEARDQVPDTNAVAAQAVSRINTGDHVQPAAPDEDEDDDEEDARPEAVEAEACGQVAATAEVLSRPDTRLPSVAVVGPEEDEVSVSCAMAEDSPADASSVRVPHPEHAGSCDVSESSSELGPGGLDNEGEEGASSDALGQTEAAAQEGGSGERLNSDQEANSDLPCGQTRSPENIGLGEGPLTRQEEDRDVIKPEETEEEEEVEKVSAESKSLGGNDAEIQETSGGEEQPVGSPASGADGTNVPQEDVEDDLRSSDEDLYRGAEELSASQDSGAGIPAPLLNVEDRCSLAPPMDVLSYSQREWRGNTPKSALIRKGYAEMSSRFGSLRIVRGDNYCALRATLFQVFTHSTQLPSWLQDGDVTTLPDQLEAQEGLISGWAFPGECLQGDGRGDAILQMKGYTEQLRAKWQAAVECSSAAERQQLCQLLFRGGEEELGLLEALKLLMLARALELHGRMQAGADVPLFCWLLFARDSSDCPRSFLSNHLSHVGLSAGLEQVEMFLLGYTLECTIQVYRLYKADTEEFVTYYPDDHKDDWPSVCLVTEDDRHYNVPIVEAIATQQSSGPTGEKRVE